MAYIGYGLVWLSTATAVSVAIVVTKSPGPLWAMIIPLLVSMETK